MNPIDRAAELERRVPAAAELMRFYQSVLTAQPRELRAVIEREGPAELAEAARNRTEPAESFMARVIRRVQAPVREPIAPGFTRNTCPCCGGLPVAAVLRPEGEGGKRYLLCSLCLTEWEFRRMLCPHCGEEKHDKLPIYTAGEFPHIRVEACDSCRHYLKAIDLTVDGRAVPEVDEMAAVVLDLWAAEQGYTKIALNLFEL
jgi:formate dehydrogenase accessory protein FdhE